MIVATGIVAPRPAPVSAVPRAESPVGPVSPSRPTRDFVVQRLGRAADALGAAARRWDNPRFDVTADFIHQAVVSLDDVLPSAHEFLNGRSDLVMHLGFVRALAWKLEAVYRAGTIPASIDGKSVPYALAHGTYLVRSVQDLLCGVGASPVSGPSPGIDPVL